jgi:type 1 glutamine amidotransferase
LKQSHIETIDPMRAIRLSLSLILLSVMSISAATPKLKALIVDGQNNHGMWPKISVMMKEYLEETGLFTVQIARTQFTWQGAQYIAEFPLENGEETSATIQPIPDADFSPNFSNYDVVINNNGWRAQPWPKATREAFEDYIQSGGGMVVVHAADNCWPEWKAYNQMIGLGGWGDRDEKSGPYVYYNNQGELVRDTSPGRGGSHGPQHEFQITIRNASHPITQGMPKQWLHAKDELYDRLRGPGENMQVLATTFSAEEKKGTGRHEPMMLTLNHGKGRIFHTPMGHADYSAECVGFIITLQRGAEWAATGKVTQTKIPSDFPTANKSSSRKFN